MTALTCADCATLARVEDRYTSPGWLGTNYDEMTVVRVRCPCCDRTGKYTRRDDGVESHQGCLAQPEPADNPRELTA